MPPADAAGKLLAALVNSRQQSSRRVWRAAAAALLPSGVTAAKSIFSSGLLLHGMWWLHSCVAGNPVNVLLLW